MTVATTATVRNAYIIPYAGAPAGGAKVRKIRVANSQTLAVGDFVVLSGGLVAIAHASATASTAFCTDVFGICQDKVSNSGTGSTTYVNVAVINENTRLIGNYCDNSVTSAATGVARLITAPNLSLHLYNMAGTWVLGAMTDATIPTNAICVGEALAPQDDPATVGTVGGRIVFKVKSSIIE